MTKLDEQLKILKKRKVRLFLILASVIVVVLGITLTLYFVGLNATDMYLVIIVAMIIILVLANRLKPKIMLYTLNQRYLLTLKNAHEPLDASTTFDAQWVKDILSKDYEYFQQSDKYDILYKTQKSREKRMFSSLYTLKVITIIKNNNIDFFAEELDKHYRNLVMESSKKNKINSQMNFQIKKYQKMKKEKFDQLNDIISFKDGKNSLITINCGYFEEDKKIYFLHSKTYFSTRFYQEAVHMAYDIINHEF